MLDLLDRLYVGVTLRKEEGQGMVEYGLIIAFVAMIVIFALMLLGPKVANIFNYAANSINK